ncbi:MAG: hypothetical protein ACI9BO_001206 [Zhongshania sp.]|jgi:hypothetical protein
MRIFMPVMAWLFYVIATPVWADCGYPDSDRGQAPEWLCGATEFEGAIFLGYGDKSRMPAISLQNRMAGKAAMIAVVEKLLRQAQTQLGSELPESIALSLPAANELSRVARFSGISVLDKVQSPQRHLYVLAGVKREDSGALLNIARDEVLAENKKAIIATLGKDGWRLLSKPRDKPALSK